MMVSCRSVVLDQTIRTRASPPSRPGPGRESGMLALIAGVDAAAARASVCARTGPNCREQLRWLARAYWKRAPERAEAGGCSRGRPWPRAEPGLGTRAPTGRAIVQGCAGRMPPPGDPAKEHGEGWGSLGRVVGSCTAASCLPSRYARGQPRVGAGGALRPGRDQVTVEEAPGWAPACLGEPSPTIAARQLRGSGWRCLLSIY